MRNKIIATLAAAACGAVLIGADAAPAAARDGFQPNFHRAYPSESYAQRRGFRGGYYGRRGYGGAAAAGVAGLAAGALIGGAIASQQYAPPPPPYAVAPSGDADWIAYCSQRYRSFDPASGTY